MKFVSDIRTAIRTLENIMQGKLLGGVETLQNIYDSIKLASNKILLRLIFNKQTRFTFYNFLCSYPTMSIFIGTYKDINIIMTYHTSNENTSKVKRHVTRYRDTLFEDLIVDFIKVQSWKNLFYSNLVWDFVLNNHKINILDFFPELKQQIQSTTSIKNIQVKEFIDLLNLWQFTYDINHDYLTVAEPLCLYFNKLLKDVISSTYYSPEISKLNRYYRKNLIGFVYVLLEAIKIISFSLLLASNVVILLLCYLLLSDKNKNSNNFKSLTF